MRSQGLVSAICWRVVAQALARCFVRGTSKTSRPADVTIALRYHRLLLGALLGQTRRAANARDDEGDAAEGDAEGGLTDSDADEQIEGQSDAVDDLENVLAGARLRKTVAELLRRRMGRFRPTLPILCSAGRRAAHAEAPSPIQTSRSFWSWLVARSRKVAQQRRSFFLQARLPKRRWAKRQAAAAEAAAAAAEGRPPNPQTSKRWALQTFHFGAAQTSQSIAGFKRSSGVPMPHWAHCAGGATRT